MSSRRARHVVAMGCLSLVTLLAVSIVSLTRPAPPSHGLTGAIHTAPLPTPLGLAEQWNGMAFINDNLWTEGTVQFAVWVDPDGSPVVGRRGTTEVTWRSTNLGLLPDNPLGAPTAPDAHNVYAIAVDSHGFVHVAGNMHASPLRYVRSKEPFGIDEWVDERMVGVDEASVTYPAFARAPGGTLLFFYRDGVAGTGDLLLNRLEPTGDWVRAATLVDGRSSDESPYLQRVAVDPARETIHIMFLWRSGNEAAGNSDASYLRSADGGASWMASDGSSVELPVTHASAEVVAERDGLLNQGGLAVDSDGRPHGMFRLQGRAEHESQVLHVWREDAGWRSEEVRGATRLVGRPAVVGDGRGPLLLLWAERTSRERSDLRVADLDGPRMRGETVLATLPVTQWEPTFDSVALLDQRELRMLLPLGRRATDEPAASGAVVTWAFPPSQLP